VVHCPEDAIQIFSLLLKENCKSTEIRIHLHVHKLVLFVFDQARKYTVLMCWCYVMTIKKPIHFQFR